MQCDYGCEQEANYTLKNGKNCCCKSPNSCPIIKEKNRQKQLGNQNTKGLKLVKRIYKCKFCNKEFSNFGIKKHEKGCACNPINFHITSWNIIPCERCGHAHNGEFGIGRFCSIRCANMKNYSKEMRENISKGLTNSFINNNINNNNCSKIKYNNCLYCNKQFITKDASNKRYCSCKCGSHQSHPGKGGGLREGGGHTKMFEYISPIAGKMKLNKDEIKLAKIFDLLKINWNRNWNGFPYTTIDGKNRKYYPDFYTKDFNIYIEYKGFVLDEHVHKMNDAQIKNNFKLLIIYSDTKRYRKMGLNIKEISQNPNLLYYMLSQ